MSKRILLKADRSGLELEDPWMVNVTQMTSYLAHAFLCAGKLKISNSQIDDIQSFFQAEIAEEGYTGLYQLYRYWLDGADIRTGVAYVLAHQELLCFSDTEIERLYNIYNPDPLDQIDPNAEFGDYGADTTETEADFSKCEICEYPTITGMGDICDVCGWEDSPTYEGISLANSFTGNAPAILALAKENWKRDGNWGGDPLSPNGDFLKSLFDQLKTNSAKN